MLNGNLIVVGASAGGVAALRELAGGLPPDLAVPVLIALHIAPHAGTNLPDILSRAGPLPAAYARDGELLAAGRLYLAAPDHHLGVEDGHARLTRGPRDNGHRPSVDVLFRSAARAYGPRAVGVVLSGTLYDGTAGLLALRRRGGIGVVQDPEDAAFPDMPRSALDIAGADHVVSIAEMPALLAELADGASARRTGSGAAHAPMPESSSREGPPGGVPSPYGCPDCGGVLWEMNGGDVPRFECRVGHGYSPEGLLVSQEDRIDDALWASFRALSENASLARKLEARARERGARASAQRFGDRALEAERRARTLQRLLDARNRHEDRERSSVSGDGGEDADAPPA